MNIKNIVEGAKTRLDEMGGGEQFLGHLPKLAKQCKIKDPTDFVIDLGEALEAEGLQLVTGAGAPDELYASPLDD